MRVCVESATAQQNVKIVFFIGGVTFAEIAALRWWAKQEGTERTICYGCCCYCCNESLTPSIDCLAGLGIELIIATTQIINGDSLLDSLVERVEGAGHPALSFKR